MVDILEASPGDNIFPTSLSARTSSAAPINPRFVCFTVGIAIIFPFVRFQSIKKSADTLHHYLEALILGFNTTGLAIRKWSGWAGRRYLQSHWIYLGDYRCPLHDYKGPCRCLEELSFEVLPTISMCWPLVVRRQFSKIFVAHWSWSQYRSLTFPSYRNVDTTGKSQHRSGNGSTMICMMSFA